jgi:hypothetical protein
MEAGAADPAGATGEHTPEAAEASEVAEAVAAAREAGVVHLRPHLRPPLTRHEPEAAMTPRSATSYLGHLRRLRAAPHACVHP